MAQVYICDANKPRGVIWLAINGLPFILLYWLMFYFEGVWPGFLGLGMLKRAGD